MKSRKRPAIGDQVPIPEDGYPSARDMPSFFALEQQLKMLKTLAPLVPDARLPIRELEQTLQGLTGAVDGFYRVLAGRDWVFHDQLDVDEMRPAIEAGDVAGLESYLIGKHSEPATLERFRAQLNVIPNMPERIHLVDLAREDHLGGRYYATVLTLLTVMDGFVNEFGKARRGLSSRDVGEIDPWDSAVGHHGGLKAAHRSFTKTFKATSTDEVLALHRNGIVHGNLPNFNNVTVAAKAWNRLMAIADWARSLEAASKPQTPKPPPIRESMAQVAATVQRTQRLKVWTGRTVTAHDHGAEAVAAEPVGSAAIDLFESWRVGNYGRMAQLLTDAAKGSGLARHAGELRRRFKDTHLTSFEVLEVRMLTSSMALTVASLTVDGRTFINDTRWMREDQHGNAVPEFEVSGTWRSIHNYPDEYGQRFT